ncbi:nucleotidyltransferase family protein [Pseudoalteromonas spongiae]|uniref:nucleotidyltransferase family protein n=1 Tax=Pseudoalteromonas spongiae TaxID=298657 RepID=UPI002017BAF1|nr:nucleotidyltransferase family protein [Pseudoalteromonas spongiae]
MLFLWGQSQALIQFKGGSMTEWQSVIIKSSASFENAIKVLDSTGKRIVLITDDTEKLIGIVTDGDVRRGLLRHVDFASPVTHVMCSDPVIVPQGTSRKEVLTVMEERSVIHVPVVNSDHEIVGLHTVSEFYTSERYDNYVFLMAGGFGTRLRPLTDECPKPMLKVGGKPMLEIILQSFIEAGFHKFIVSTHYLAEQIKEYFQDGRHWGVTIDYVHEAEPLGTAGALGLLPKEKIDKPFFVMNGDLLTNVDFRSLSDFHANSNSMATMCVREYSQQVPYGVIQHDNEKITDIVEKPTQKYFVNAGIYMLSPKLLDYVAPNQRVDMPDLLNQCVEDNSGVSMFPIHEYWLDIGRLADFEKAQLEVMELINKC